MKRPLLLALSCVSLLAFVVSCANSRFGGAVAGSAAAPSPGLGEARGADEVWYIERAQADEPGSRRDVEQDPSAPGAPASVPMDRSRGDERAGLFGDDARSRRGDELDSLPFDAIPGCGGIVARRPETSGRTGLASIPLLHTSIDASVQGTAASVRVRQRFSNPWSEKIEAVYVFPLPADAAVHDFLMTIGDRTIRGIVREREEARRLYEAARAQGYVASLLTQERPNVFTQKVANIEPGKSIDVDVRYFHLVPWIDGWHELVVPTVVGPRFSPPGQQHGIGAVAEGAHGTSGQPVEVEYRRPEQWPASALDLAVDLDAGAEVLGLQCRTHEIQIGEPSPERRRVTITGDRQPNRDFVLRWKVGGDRLAGAFAAHDDGRDGWFQLTLYPPSQLETGTRPLDVVFVVDTSGSMEGAPLAQAQAALHRALDLLGPRDAFQILRFAERASSFANGLVPAGREEVRHAHSFVDALRASGGTLIVEGLRAALAQPASGERERLLVFLSDGFVDNEDEILSLLESRRGDVRVLAIGIGAAPNRYLIDEMARAGDGAASYVGAGDDRSRIGRIVERFVDTLRAPALADVRIDWGGLAVSDVYPERVPDLLRGRPVTLVGKLGRGASGATNVRIDGNAGGERIHMDVPVRIGAGSQASRALPLAWARARIGELARHARRGDAPNARDEILRTALEFGIVSPLTAFVAVDSLSRTAGDHGTSVAVPAALPQGVRYETTVTGPR